MKKIAVALGTLILVLFGIYGAYAESCQTIENAVLATSVQALTSANDGASSGDSSILRNLVQNNRVVIVKRGLPCIIVSKFLLKGIPCLEVRVPGVKSHFYTTKMEIECR